MRGTLDPNSLQGLQRSTIHRCGFGIASPMRLWKSACAVNQTALVCSKELQFGHGRGKCCIPTQLVSSKSLHDRANLRLLDKVGIRDKRKWCSLCDGLGVIQDIPDPR